VFAVATIGSVPEFDSYNIPASTFINECHRVQRFISPKEEVANLRSKLRGRAYSALNREDYVNITRLTNKLKISLSNSFSPVAREFRLAGDSAMRAALCERSVRVQIVIDEGCSIFHASCRCRIFTIRKQRNCYAVLFLCMLYLFFIDACT